MRYVKYYFYTWNSTEIIRHCHCCDFTFKVDNSLSKFWYILYESQKLNSNEIPSIIM